MTVRREAPPALALAAAPAGAAAEARTTHFVLLSNDALANIVKGLTHAFELAPRVSRLRMPMAYQSVREERLKKARGMLMPLPFKSHRPPDNVAARRVA